MRALFVCLLVTFALTTGAIAQSDGVSERERSLFGELRCVVCQNQSILDSDADVAKDLRQIVREQIASGRSDTEIRSFLVDRYGEFILLKPVIAPHTIALWIAPILFVLIGIVLVFRTQRRKIARADGLSSEERAEIDAVKADGRVQDGS